ncbi:MarR family winged helix-turn-helix transcriptional regulator [Shewanella putrefaciens]|uniref:MarR family transcriptional regulator n=1 Tax=Shewanella putrefaciens TaxID=24 RepID=A0ABX8XF14_SHEPU|nr:MarR family transcriptional regulator [Shewanella putrefaciens]AVV83092.1 transcriptional regulator [Shewanella putrefaciens]MCT8942369.1 MarR family transcriptional regulator [Shewanella putrefaciens]QSE50591.1 MarR family transcriptional regulator [Shewanella putrefaciens]QYX74001.1 MarR family transcriptional regulator [Shewanella putrefaciens]GGN13683.1 MarR family transcriptional regulator [Shewanella putrefaciens]
MAAKMTLTHASPADTNASSTNKKKADSNPKEDGLDRIVEQWQQQGVTEDLIPMAVLGRIARLTKYIEVVLLQCHAEFGLGQGEFDVLATLRRSGKPFTLSPSQLYQSMMLSSGAMTSRLDRLENKGLIEREHSKEDRRGVHVSLTAEGKALIDKALPQHIQCQSALFAGVSVEDRPVLLQILKSWLNQFEPQ